MDFGLMIMTRGPGGTGEGLTAMARGAEKGGLDYIAVSDHVVVPADIGSRYPYSATGEWAGAKVGECLETLTSASFIAAATTTPRILTSVLVVPHRPAILAAKMLTTVDVLSGGRLTVGCGAGWMREEFEALGTPPFESRGKVTDEFIAVFRELWTADRPTYDGEFVTVSDVLFEPKPLQKPHPPIWIGGESGPAIRRAGRIGDGWYPADINPAFPIDTPERYGAAVDKLDAAATAAGRDPADIDRAFITLEPVNPEARYRDNERVRFSGPPEAYAEDIAAFACKGVGTIIFTAVSPELSQAVEKIDWLCREVLPLAR